MPGGSVGRGARWLAAGLAAAVALGPARVESDPGTPAACPRRVLQVVAHTDDDLLFMNPDVQHDVEGGFCVRTVYLTAGDSGEGLRYWGRREAGVLAAYALMASAENRWTTGDVPGTAVRLRTLAANPNVSLAFLRLPDGGRRGQGFARRDGASLAKLWDGDVARIRSVDGVRPATYTRASLVATLGALIAEFRPDTIRVQDADSEPHDDHSDHGAAARFAVAARASYARPHVLMAYAGYVSEHRPENVAGADLRAKKAAFYAYAAYDRRACDSDRTCTGKYAAWLRRQYVVTLLPSAV